MKKIIILILKTWTLGLVFFISGCNLKNADTPEDISEKVDEKIYSANKLENLSEVFKDDYMDSTALNAYKKLLEEERIDWDGNGELVKTENMQFALVSTDREEYKYLLLKCNESYEAAGTQHLLYFYDGKIQTLWGLGQNCICIEGFLKDKKSGKTLYLKVGGGRQDVMHGNIIRLDSEKTAKIAETVTYLRWNEEIEDLETENHFYWDNEEISEKEYEYNYNDFLIVRK